MDPGRLPVKTLSVKNLDMDDARSTVSSLDSPSSPPPSYVKVTSKRSRHELLSIVVFVIMLAMMFAIMLIPIYTYYVSFNRSATCVLAPATTPEVSQSPRLAFLKGEPRSTESEPGIAESLKVSQVSNKLDDEGDEEDAELEAESEAEAVAEAMAARALRQRRKKLRQRRIKQQQKKRREEGIRRPPAILELFRQLERVTDDMTRSVIVQNRRDCLRERLRRGLPPNGPIVHMGGRVFIAPDEEALLNCEPPALPSRLMQARSLGPMPMPIVAMIRSGPPPNSLPPFLRRFPPPPAHGPHHGPHNGPPTHPHMMLVEEHQGPPSGHSAAHRSGPPPHPNHQHHQGPQGRMFPPQRPFHHQQAPMRMRTAPSVFQPAMARFPR